jgi:hypothetical protein
MAVMVVTVETLLAVVGEVLVKMLTTQVLVVTGVMEALWLSHSSKDYA